MAAADTEEAQLSPAPSEFYERLQRLIAAYHPHLRASRIQVKVRETADTTPSSVVLAEVDTPDKPSEERQFDFTMWFAADAWAGFSELQRDALMEHELFHAGYDDKGKPLLITHDFEEFNAVIYRYGLWGPGAQDTLLALNNMPVRTGPESEVEMPQGYQTPAPGSGGYGGVKFQRPVPGSGGYGGVKYQQGAAGVVWSDPDLQEGGDFYSIDIGGGRLIELSPAAYQAAVASIQADMDAMSGDAQPGSGGYGGVKR